MHYGFQKLGLLNSGGYQRAEMPLDAAVSLIAPNNTGKTTLINALQFLLIIDKRHMDFGAHDLESSRRFYFPDNGAYILLEVSLPGGTAVLGCVGKGFSHEYEYFTYQGELNLDDYRTDNGQTVRHPQLVQHLAQRQKRAFILRQDEFTSAIYGQRKRLSGEPDIRIFRLTQPSLIRSFQRVMGQTLKLESLSAAKIKEHLLHIFSHELHDANVDFKKNWDKAFADVEASRRQYTAAFRQKERINRLEALHTKRRELRGKIRYFRPIVERQLEEWHAYYAHQHEQFVTLINAITADKASLRSKLMDGSKQLGVLEAALERLNETDRECEALSIKLALVTHRGILEQRHAAATQAYESAITQIGQVDGRSTNDLNRELLDYERKQREMRQALENLGDNLYLHLKTCLPPEQLTALNRSFSRQTMQLPASAFDMEPETLGSWLASSLSPDQESLQLPGLNLRLSNLSPQFTERGRDEIEADLHNISPRILEVRKKLETAADLKIAKEQKARLEAERTAIQKELEEFDTWQELCTEQETRNRQRHLHEEQIRSIQAELDHAEAKDSELTQQRLAVDQQLTQLENQNKTIGDLKRERRDLSQAFTDIETLPHTPWISKSAPSLNELAQTLTQYQDDCKELAQQNQNVTSLLLDIRKEGLNKFDLMDSEDSEAESIISFFHHLPQELEAIERSARSAVVEVTSSLRSLRGNLDTFKNRIYEFNRLIGQRKLSDLAVFRINAINDPMLVGAMEQLIATAETVDQQGTYALFDQTSILDDRSINLAKERLIEAGEKFGGLRVEHFFELEFEVGKKDRKPESFKEMDKAASNGTVLMAKLITGLAMLHLMLDPRHRVRAVCYLDEALALDPANQRSLIDTADGFGFSLILASPAPLITARYCIPITTLNGKNQISKKHWQLLEHLEAGARAG